MRYRKLGKHGDYIFGFGQSCFFIDNVEAVAQLISTRLQLWSGEWFLDINEGMPYRQEVLGRVPKGVSDSAVRNRVLGTTGVVSIDSFSSTVQNREYDATMTVTTQFGSTQVTT